ncbi:DUF2231 domain-containing protein [Rhodococcus sp. Z13]|uniref:DUF2231 domain-containing protein n=1 Tax=Rhodococcus sacchari TaxID=2962047 RepID=A0ACD4DH03_9NOCA|nr:DUF2231 domain-containing protein [Rhodococcus sp. Z13]UYP19264.1 DUF2231 domain-containing protein [Rhodococcus sp. Z13]
MNVHRILRAVESLDRVDGPAAAVARTVRGLLEGRKVDGLLRGSWLGHPVHPVLVTVPIGMWSGALLLDLMRGQRDASRRLVGIGLLAALPTVVTGYADFSALQDVRQRRVGAVHAVSNAVAIDCFLTSYVLRTRGSDRAATLWGLLDMGAVGAGGALGGHLSYAQGGGVFRWQAGPEADAAVQAGA